VRNGEGSDMKTNRAHVHICSFLFFRTAKYLSRTIHVCSRSIHVASFADQKEKNLDANEHLENGR